MHQQTWAFPTYEIFFRSWSTLLRVTQGFKRREVSKIFVYAVIKYSRTFTFAIEDVLELSQFLGGYSTNIGIKDDFSTYAQICTSYNSSYENQKWFINGYTIWFSWVENYILK